MRRLLLRLFARLASSVGVPEIQARLDRLDLLLGSMSTQLGPLADQVDRRLSDLGGALNQHLEMELQDLRANMEEMRAALQVVGSDLVHLHNQQLGHFENRLTSLNDALVAYVNAKQAQQDLAMHSTKSELVSQQAQVRQSLDALRLLISNQSLKSEGYSASQSQTPTVLDDAFYVALENHFRGSRDLIAERQSAYVQHLPSVVNEEHPVIDLGCGRGEWLAALATLGIPAQGVDSNIVCVAECANKDLQVELADLVDFLHKRPNQSAGAFTMFQVLEHLPFDVLLVTLREIRRILVPGGRLIAEVPNAKNLRVAAGTFWIDPTHQRPLHPELLLFLAEEIGFVDTFGVYSNDDSPKFDLSSLPEGPREALQRVIDSMDAAGDFALIATA